MSTEVVEAPAGTAFTASDRCDQCGARAYASAQFKAGDLLFCIHHWNAYSAPIQAQAISLRDETHLIA